MIVPHQAIITIDIELMERLKDGKVQGPVEPKNRTILSINGASKDDCTAKVSEVMSFLVQACSELSNFSNAQE